MHKNQRYNPINWLILLIVHGIWVPVKEAIIRPVPVPTAKTSLQLLEESLTQTRQERMYKSTAVEISELEVAKLRLEEAMLVKRIARFSRELKEEATAVAQAKKELELVYNVVSMTDLQTQPKEEITSTGG